MSLSVKSCHFNGDVIVCGYRCSGVEWVQGIIRFLQPNNGCYSNDVNTHPNVLSYVDLLPSQCPLFTQSNKIILVVRNPKDVAVAIYKLMGFETNDHFLDFFTKFQTVDISSSGELSWFNHTLQWESALAQLPAEIVHVVYFENLTQNLEGEVAKLGQFMDMQVDNTIPRRSLYNLSPEKILEIDEPKRKRLKPAYGRENTNTDMSIYDIGMWKHFFTVQQYDEFNDIFKTKMKNTNFDTTYME